MEEKKKNNAETLEQVKKEYQKSCMTQEQVEQMKKRRIPRRYGRRQYDEAGSENAGRVHEDAAGA